MEMCTVLAQLAVVLTTLFDVFIRSTGRYVACNGAYDIPPRQALFLWSRTTPIGAQGF